MEDGLSSLNAGARLSWTEPDIIRYHSSHDRSEWLLRGPARCGVIRRPGRRELLVIWGLAVIAAVISVCARCEPRFPGDLRLTLLIQSIDSAALDSIMEWTSLLTGDWQAVALAIAGSIVIWRCLGKWEAGLVLMTWLSSPIHSGLKLIVNRPRPTPDLVRVFQYEQGNSFPSGHAFFAIVFWGLLAYLALTRLKRRSLRRLAFSGSLVIILWIGASRVYLGAHWPSDVLGGYVIGALLLAALIWLDRKWKSRIMTGSRDEPTHSGLRSS